MPLRTALSKVLAEYQAATGTEFKGNPLAQFLRHELPDTLIASIENSTAADDNWILEGSAGQGQWTRCPWVAIFDPEVTRSAQRGYYPVYLFREDLTGVYLSLNQGVTDVREQYKSRAKDALRTRAADYRARLGKDGSTFPLGEIDLQPSQNSSYAADYEAGNIVAVFYSANSLPSEEVLTTDLKNILTLYSQLTLSIGTQQPLGLEPEEQDNDLIENYAAFRMHRAIERKPSVAKKVKEVRGYVCEACGFHFPTVYSGIRKNRYIEAHHLIPISQLKGTQVSRDPKTDFVVLCANCHRMIHRHPEPGNLAAFKQTLQT
jgi:5-methylcytosine-specific restriction enzyme A